METIISTQYYRHPKLASYNALITDSSAILPQITAEQNIEAGSVVTVRPIDNSNGKKFKHFIVSGVESNDIITDANPYIFTMPANDVKIVAVYEDIPGTNIQPSKTATPGAEEQTIRPDAGYDALAQVIVEAVPPSVVSPLVATPTNEQQIYTAPANIAGYTPVTINATPTEEKQITQNGVYVPTDGKFFSSVTVNVTGSETNIQPSKTATPGAEEQIIKPDTGYNALAQVVVESVALDENNTFTTNGTKTAADGKYYKTININVPTSGGASAKTWTYTPASLPGTGGSHVTEEIELFTDEFIAGHYDDNTIILTMYPNDAVTYQRGISTPAPSAFIFARADINSGMTQVIKLSNYTENSSMTQVIPRAIAKNYDGAYGQFRIYPSGKVTFYNSTRSYLDPATSYTIIAEVGVTNV